MTPAARRLIAPALATAMALAILLALGTWQLQRRAWKEALIAQVTARTTMAPLPLPPPAQWSAALAEALAYRPVIVTGALDSTRIVRVHTHLPDPRGGPHRGPGAFVLSPLTLADGAVVIVNRGFVPDALRDDPAIAAPGPREVTLTALLRIPEDRNLFTPDDDLPRRLLYARDPAAAARALGLGAVAPFTLDLVAPRPPGGLPQAGETRVSFPNRHLEYALTWFGLAGALVAVFGAFAARRLRADRGGPPAQPSAGATSSAGG